jgi:hypothetical protein
MRKKIQTLTSNENPNAREIYSSVDVLAGLSTVLLGGVFAT